ncbi:hypothetical protein FH972_003786 [Carpinus fangiana]|uniref:Uncharacterized protein n=1 Tax=Carpinus fangiana TaxID=176857 RepID=A0A5N6QLU1_9ROSI|nr:hypothetical protein FH972_003786 [Carpinus fangiana]
MAAAEARVVWQRTVNRCFVQEDAKRAPKLACCQSSSSASEQVDAGPNSTAGGPDRPALGFMPNRNPSFSNLSPDTRWWLQLQPSYGYQKGVTYEQLNALEAEVETLSAGSVNTTTTTFDEVNPQKGGTIYVDDHKNSESSLDMQYGRLSAVCMNTAPEVRKQEVKALCGKNPEEYLELMDMRGNYEFVGMDRAAKQANEFCLDPDSPWIGSGKTEPWWRTSDKDELASLVMKNSLNHIENCDLPPPQKMYARKHPYAHSGCFDHDEALASSFDWKAQTSGISNRTHVQVSPDSLKTHGNERASSDERCSQCGSDKSFSYSTNHKDIREMPQVSEGDLGKAQLMEALCHSQTRAREAEKAAKQAYAEKEHILKLFFRQASHLFAYKQWFQLLQLETLYFQIKNKDKSISSLFPVAVPWTPYKGRKQRKSWQKATKGRRVKRGRPRHDIKKYAVAFALGLSLVGAGLVLGWTVGWMLPPF